MPQRRREGKRRKGAGIATERRPTTAGRARASVVSKRYRVLDELIEGCQVISPEWRYLYLNHATARQAHRPREELRGRRMVDEFPGIPISDDGRRAIAVKNVDRPDA